MIVGDRKNPRGGEEEDCYERHREWSHDMWTNTQLPKVKNLLYATIGSLIVLAVIGATGIANWRVSAADHATKSEVKEVETELKIEMQTVKKELKEEINKLDELHRQGFEKMDTKMEEMMRLLMTHDRNGGSP